MCQVMTSQAAWRAMMTAAGSVPLNTGAAGAGKRCLPDDLGGAGAGAPASRSGYISSMTGELVDQLPHRQGGRPSG